MSGRAPDRRQHPCQLEVRTLVQGDAAWWRLRSLRSSRRSGRPSSERALQPPPSLPSTSWRPCACWHPAGTVSVSVGAQPAFLAACHAGMHLWPPPLFRLCHLCQQPCLHVLCSHTPTHPAPHAALWGAPRWLNVLPCTAAAEPPSCPPQPLRAPAAAADEPCTAQRSAEYMRALSAGLWEELHEQR